jgi:glutaminyl-peptide cyclotransferase
MSRRIFFISIILGMVVLVAGLVYFSNQQKVHATAPKVFDGQRAMQDVVSQVKLGPRIPGSEPHRQIVGWIQQELTKNGWASEIQAGSLLNHPIQNVIGKRGSGTPWILLGAHFDTRMIRIPMPPCAINQFRALKMGPLG